MKKIEASFFFSTQSSQLDISYPIAQLCYVHHNTASSQHVSILNDIVKYLRIAQRLTLWYNQLFKNK